MSSRSAALVAAARRPAVLGLLVVGLLAAAYPPIAHDTQQPLTAFGIPMLIVCALDTWSVTAAVSAVALAAAILLGVAQPDLDGAGLAVRIVTLAITAIAAVVLAFERGRRQQQVDAARSRGIVMDIFEDSLVPTPIPPPGVTVTTRYLPGDHRMQLGGDFFDAIRLPNGHLGYIIGDVCGQGPRAAAFGAAVRSGWKTLATTRPDDPLAWVEGLDETFFRLGRHADTFVTLNTGVIAVGERPEWVFVSAGHPWPVLVGETVLEAAPEVGPPLGAGAQRAWSVTRVRPMPGDQVLLYTDGLIENPVPGGQRSNLGSDRLLEHLRSTPFTLDGLLREFGPEGFDDDVAVMAISL